MSKEIKVAQEGISIELSENFLSRIDRLEMRIEALERNWRMSMKNTLKIYKIFLWALTIFCLLGFLYTSTYLQGNLIHIIRFSTFTIVNLLLIIFVTVCEKKYE